MPPVPPVVPVPPSDEQVGDAPSQETRSLQIGSGHHTTQDAQLAETTAQSSRQEQSRLDHEADSDVQPATSTAETPQARARRWRPEHAVGPDVQVATHDAIVRADADTAMGGDDASGSTSAPPHGSGQIDHHYTPQTLRRISKLRRFGQDHVVQPPRAPDTDANAADSTTTKPANWTVAAINSRSDLYHIAFVLQNTLPVELVPQIMEDAEHFERLAIGCTFNPERSVQEYNSPQQMLRTPPIATKVRRPHPVLEVQFEIEGHDQGWASHPNAGTWTWFDAWIHRPSAYVDQAGTAEEARDFDDFHPPLRDLFRKTWVAENPQAKREWTKQTIIWSADSENEAHREFVRALRPGDSISIHASARFGGWCNYVRNVGVTITMPAVVR